MIGATLSHYRIESKLGEGGMGVVYRAFDTRLNRTVAIKVLPPDAMADPGRKRRFIQEAQAASALNHPNIITVHEIDTAGPGGRPVDFMVMEYVAGKTLDQCIGRSGLRLSEVVKYGTQIADALARAHAAGIVHRDIKPGNVMVTEDGLVKVLDFGLAKLTEAVGSDDRTLSLRTQEGVIAGTVAYMSPEQAEGRKVDARSDIFSFGSLLYEMVTGRRAFQGETRVSTWSAILNKEPEALRPIVPRDLEKLVARCLRKDPGRRMQHMGDVRALLEEVQEETASVTIPGKRGRLPYWPAIAAALLLAAAGWWWWRQPKPVERLPVLTRLTSDSGLSTDPALSPDGKLLAYTSDRSGEGHLDIWVRQVAGGQPIRLTTDPADDHEPAFSPDGSLIVFRSERGGGGLYVVPALGGEDRLLAPQGRNPRYSPDGKWIAYWVGEQHASRNIHIIASFGGPSRVLGFRPKIEWADFPLWSPDGKHLLFLGSAKMQTGFEWWVASVETGVAVPTGAFQVFRGQGLPDTLPLLPIPGDWVGDQILFSARLGDSAGLCRLPISRQNWKITGPPQPLTHGTGLDTNPSAGGSRLVFSSLAENVDIWSLPIDANQAKPRGDLRRLTQDAAIDSLPSISPDGKQMVFRSNRSGAWNIWSKDLETGRESPLTMGAGAGAVPNVPLLAAGRSRIGYNVQENGKSYTYILTTTLGPGGAPRPGVAEKVCEDCGILSDLSADGQRTLYYGTTTAETGGEIRVFNITAGQKARLLRDERFFADPRFSPDERWIAFHANLGPLTRQVFVARPGTPPQEWIPVTDGSAMDRFANWSPDGNILYFVSERDGFRCLAARRLDPATKKPLGPVFDVQHFHSTRRSMMNLAAASTQRFSVARDQIVFTLPERTGNIWMTELAPIRVK